MFLCSSSPHVVFLLAEREIGLQSFVRALQLGHLGASATMLGINAVAAPIFDGKDACAGALALVGSIQFLPADIDAKSAAALRAAAAQISRLLGTGTPGKKTA